jgi:uncharacterized protein (TIGR01777 family)
MKRIVMPGGSGYLGMRLAAHLVARGDEVTILTRGAERDHQHGLRHVHWDGRTRGPWEEALEGADAVVHLAGKRVDCRPTRKNVDAFIRSRVESVSVVGEAIRACGQPPPVWVQCATLAVFGDTGDAVLTEATVPDGLGPRQSTTVALAWEHAFQLVARGIERSVLLRIGVVLGDGDPADDRLRRLARMGLAGPIAGGKRWMSWVALEDAMRVMLRAIDDPAMSGTYHLTAPEPVTNTRFMAAIRTEYGRRFGLPSPTPLTWLGAWALGSDPALALTGRRAVPRRLLQEGYTFRYPQLEEALGLGMPEALMSDPGRRAAA